MPPYRVSRHLRFYGLLLAAIALSLALTRVAHSQAFPQPVIVKTGNWPAAVYTADVNNDGYADLIYIDQGAAANQPSVTHILLNNGSGSFTQSASVATVGNSLAIGTFLGTGHVDIAWMTTSPSGFGIHVAPGTGTGTFLPAIDLTNNNFPGARANPTQWGYLAAGTSGVDTAHATLIAEDLPSSTLYTFRFSGGTNGGAIAESYNVLPDGPGPALLADLNGDGYNDLTVEGLTTFTPQVFLGNDNGLSSFSTALRFTSSPVHSLLLQDINLDGRLDLIAEGTDGRIDVFPGNGDGTFQAASVGGTGTLDGLSGNGGHLVGFTQLPGGQPAAFTSTPAGISALLGQGNAYLGLKGIYNAGPGHTSFASADFNADGILDIAVDAPEGIAILYGNANGSFQTSQAFATGKPALSIAVADFNGDGALDAVVSTAATQGQVLLGANVGLLLAPGYPGTPVPTTTQSGPAGLWSQVGVGNFDGSGTPGLSFTADGSLANLPQTGYGVAVQGGFGDGSFTDPEPVYVEDQFARPNPSTCQPPFSNFPGLLYGSGTIADFTGDGLADLANRDSGAFRVLRGNPPYAGTASFPVPTLFWSGGDGGPKSSDCNLNAHSRVVTGDFKGGGRPDLIFQSDGTLQLYLTDSTGTPIPTGDLAADGSLTTPGQLTAPDLSYVFGGPSVALAGNYAIGAMASADLDRDGNVDLLVTYHNVSADPSNPSSATPDYLYTWFGSGGGRFLTSAAHPVNPVRTQLSRNYYQVAVADLNGDGIPDLILSDGYLLDVQNGVGDGTFGPEQHLLAGAGINGIATGRLLKTGGATAPDLLIANGGLTFSNPAVNHETLTPNPDVNTGGVTAMLNPIAETTPVILPGDVGASPEPSVVGASFVLRVTYSPLSSYGAPSGTVVFLVNGAPVSGALTLASIGNNQFTASITVPGTYAAGVYPIAAVFQGDSIFAASTLANTHTVVAATPATGSLAATPEPSPFEQPFTITATISNASSGTVAFSVDGTALSTPAAVDSNGVATIVDSAKLLPGQHALTATYTSGTTSFALTPATHTVALGVTSVVLTPTTPLTVYYGQGVDGTFAISVVDQANYPATGNYSLEDNGADVPICTSLPVKQACPYGAPILLDAGPHVFTITYLGDVVNARSVSAPIAYTVLPDLTTASLTTSANPSLFGANLTLTATISGNIVTPNGSVTFFDGTSAIGKATLNTQGIATLQTSSLAPGQHSLMVSYPGTIDFNPASTANAPLLQQIVLAPIQYATSITISSSLNPAGPTQTVILTAAVTVSSQFAMIATGQVNFTIDGQAAGSASLDSSGLARITAPQLAPGQHTVVAMYAGVTGSGGTSPVKPPNPPQPIAPRLTTNMPTLLASTSAPYIQVISYSIVQAPSVFTLEISPTPVTLGVGRYAILLVKISELSGFNQPVALTCSGLPYESACTFVQPTIAAGGGSTTLQLQVSAPHDCGNPGSPYFLGQNTPGAPFSQTLPYGAGIALGGVVALGLRRRRKDGRRLRLLQNFLLLALLSGGLYGLSGCGHCTDLGTIPGTYNVTVTAVAQGGPVTETQSQTIGLTVTIP
jgi:hypothetical protein